MGQTLDKGKIKEILGDNLVLFGEWLVPHSVVYPEDKYNHMYFYDCYDVIKISSAGRGNKNRKRTWPYICSNILSWRFCFMGTLRGFRG